jgi:hypothetical protein
MAVGVNIVSTFNSKGISKAISDFKKLESAGDKATFGLRSFDKAATNGLKKVAKYGGLAAAGFGAIALNFVKGAEFAKQADDRLAAVNKTMGLFGSQTDAVTKRLIEIGDKGEYKFGILAESIKDVQSKLLTFKEIAQEANVTGGLFDRATQAALDLQAAGFGEATQNAVQLGKALNDPVKGITALARSGVTFTAQEKEKIKALVESGKMYEAQELLLKAIETQVGGTAEATTTATFKIGSAFGHVRDELGTLLLPLFEKFADFMVNKVVPYATEFGQVVGEKGLGGGLGMLAGTFFTATANMGAFGNAMLALIAIFVAVKLVTIAATIAQNLFNVSLLANPIGIIVAAVIVLIVALVALYIKFEVVRKVINAVINFIIGIIENWLNVWIFVINGVISYINILIKAANFFGAGLTEIGKIGEVEFGRIGKAADKAGAKIEAVNMKWENFGAKVKATKKEDEKDPPFSGVSDGAGGAAKTIETAKEKLQKYIDALKGMSSAQKSARDADKSLLKSRTSLAEATLKLTDAQAYFNQVVAGYGADSKQAKDRQLALRKAQGDVEKAGYDVEGSVFAVTKAEQELAAVRADPESSPQAIREAEISLAEAKLGVKDATESQVEATDALAEAETLLNEAINGAKDGTETYKDALDKLNDAKRAQADAEEAVTEAIERQTEAVERLTEAEQKARDARTGVKDAAAAAAEAKVGIAPKPSASYASFLDAVKALHPNSPTLKSSTPVADSKERFPKLFTDYKSGSLVALAQGGIVTRPTAALIGEAGAEAVIPLDKMNQGMTINLTINAGMGTDPAKLGDEIVDVLTRYQRRNGALPLKVA